MNLWPELGGAWIQLWGNAVSLLFRRQVQSHMCSGVNLIDEPDPGCKLVRLRHSFEIICRQCIHMAHSRIFCLDIFLVLEQPVCRELDKMRL